MQLARRTALLGPSSSNNRGHRPPLSLSTSCTPFYGNLNTRVCYISCNSTANSYSNRSIARSSSDDSNDNPDLDEIELDDAYYAEIGMTREEAMRQQKEMLYNIDPDALLLDDIGKIDDSMPEEWKKAIESLEVYGPKALIMAGFRAEEYAVARATLDQLGADAVKVLPATHDMLQSPLDLALATAEIDWSAPRPPEWIQGGAWGSQRTVMFSGLSLKAQATILEYLEAQGLPHICVTMALKEDGDKILGVLLAAAVQAQRNAKLPKVAPWEIPKQNAAASSSASSSSAAMTTSTSSSSSSSSVRKGSNTSTVPGKRGPLFARRSGAAAAGGGGSGSSSSSSSAHWREDGLEDLQDLISPEVAKQRLKFNAEEVRNKITDILDTEMTDEIYAHQNNGQQQQSSSSSSSGSSSATPGPTGTKDDTQAVLDWFNDESTGKIIELPWLDDQSTAAAAAEAAAAAGVGAEDNSVRAADSGLDISLDDLLPAQSDLFQQAAGRVAASSTAASSSSSSDALYSNASSEDSGSVFSAIQAALKSGVAPDQLKQLIDAAAAASAAASDPVDLLLNEDAAMQRKAKETADALKAANSSSRARNAQPGSSGSKLQGNASVSPSLTAAAAATPAAAAAAKVQAEYGPEPPPPGTEFGQSPTPGVFDSDPLLKLRPEIERAFQSNQIKFVDMNKMPRKYQQRYTQEALQQQLQKQQQKSQQQQQQEEEEEEQASSGTGEKQQQRQQRWWQQQRSQQQQQLVQGLSAGVAGKIPAGGRVVEIDVEQGLATSPQQQQQQATTYSGYEVEQDGNFAPQALAAEDLQTSSVAVTDSNKDDNNKYDDLLFEGAELVGEDEDFSEPLCFDESQLQGLVDSAKAEGLDPTRALAQALAFGVQVSPEVAAAVGVALPDPDLVTSARQEIVGSIREMQAAQGLEDDEPTVVLGENGYQVSVGDGDQGLQEGISNNGLASDSSAVVGFKGIEVAAVPEGSVERSSGQSRVWGSGISSAVSRAKARLAEKKRQRQQQQQQ